MEMVKFSEKLYALDVGDIPREEIPRIVDPNDSELNNGVVVCYNPTKDQLIQLALIIWQVATRERNSSQVGTKQFEVQERLCTKTRNVLKSLLLPYVAGDSDKAKDLCIRLLRENKPILDKYLKKWSIIKRPTSVWVDKNTNGIFICENAGRIVVGLNPTNFVFVYDQGK
jgi:hypothetical protein